MIHTRNFGKLEDHDIIEATLRSDTTAVSILNYGCVIRDWQIHTANGSIPVVLGFNHFEHYPKHSLS